MEIKGAEEDKGAEEADGAEEAEEAEEGEAAEGADTTDVAALYCDMVRPPWGDQDSLVGSDLA